VCEARDGREALTAIARHKLNLLVLDLVMPELDGFQVLERLRQAPETCELPVLVLTGKDLSDAERASLTGRVISLLDKVSFSPEEILDLVGRALGADPIGSTQAA